MVRQEEVDKKTALNIFATEISTQGEREGDMRGVNITLQACNDDVATHGLGHIKCPCVRALPHEIGWALVNR